MENIFERNFKIVNPDANKIEEQKVADDPREDTGKHKIDLLDGADDEDADHHLHMLNTEGEECIDEDER